MFTHTWMKWTLISVWITEHFLTYVSEKRQTTCAPTSSRLFFGSHSIVLLLIYKFTNHRFRSCHHKLPTVNELLRCWKKHTLYAFASLISAIRINYKNTLTAALGLVFNRKLAVWAAAGGWLGIGRWPNAMPTIAVMWVSVPKTWMGIPVVFPVATKMEPEEK